MPPLDIVTNQIPPGVTHTRLDALQHLGSRDRQNPGHFFDFPGKTDALLQAACELVHAPAKRFLAPINLRVSTRVPARAQLLKGHPDDYLRRFEAAARTALEREQRGQDQFVEFGEDADVTPGTFRAALRSVGTAFDAVDVALQTPGKTAFALVWPPGHHAEPTRAMGYCYLATAALATLYARDHAIQLRPGYRNRVVLIDIDNHQGNGSAAVLSRKRDVLFVDQFYRSPYDEARQQYTDGDFNPQTGNYNGAGREYPYTRHDASIGSEPHPIASGPNVLNLSFEGFQEADTVITNFIEHALPRIQNFRPNVVLWSVGLDAAKGDPLGGLGLAPESFYTLIKGMRLALPEARHCGILEGGYDPELSPKCLKPALLALHTPPHHDVSKAFDRYRGAFMASRK